MHLEADPTEQLAPESDGIWTKSTSCLLYLRYVILPQKQMSGKSSVWSDQVLFSSFYFKNIFFYNRKSTCARANTALEDIRSIISTTTYTCAANRRSVAKHLVYSLQVPSTPLAKKFVYYQ
jgi:hypothetical protein